MTTVVKLDEQAGEIDVAKESQRLGWPLYDAPDNLWVLFMYRTLDGVEREVARTFELIRPANNNVFELRAARSQMLSLD